MTALELGADEYLAKPVRMRELITRVRKIIARTRLTPDVADSPEPGPAPAENGWRLANWS